jgi:WD40 repeat protein
VNQNEVLISSQGKDLIVTRIEGEKPTQTKLPPIHRDVIRSLTVTPDHKQWISGGFGQLNFWDIQSGQMERSITKPLKGRITALTFTADGSRLLVGESIPGVFGMIHIFQSGNTVPEHSWQAHKDEITAIQESKDGSYWMSASADHTVRFWQTDTLLEADWLEGHTAPIMGLTQNTDGSLLISAGTDNAIKVWDQQSRERLYDLGRHQFGLMDLLWKTDKSELYALNQKGNIYRYQELKVHTGAQSSNTGREKVISRTKKPGSCLTYWEKHDLLVMGTFEGELHAYTLSGKSAWKTKPFEDTPKSLASQ